MSNEIKPITAEEINAAHYALETLYPMQSQQIPRNLFSMVVVFGARYSAQQTAALREELTKAKSDGGKAALAHFEQAKELDTLRTELERAKQSAHSEKLLREQAERLYNAEHTELEAVKKERDTLKGLCWTLAALSHVTGEVVDGYRVREVVLEMRRLSSGETKPSESANTKPE